MKAIVSRYIADDGHDFATEEQAKARDLLVFRCRQIDDLLPRRDPSHGSKDRLAIPLGDLEVFKRALVALCRGLLPNEKVFDHPPEEIHPFSYAGRIVSEALPHCVNVLWWRLSCIHDGWEYEQPFFALNPEVWQKEFGDK